MLLFFICKFFFKKLYIYDHHLTIHSQCMTFGITKVIFLKVAVFLTEVPETSHTFIKCPCKINKVLAGLFSLCQSSVFKRLYINHFLHNVFVFFIVDAKIIQIFQTSKQKSNFFQKKKTERISSRHSLRTTPARQTNGVKKSKNKQHYAQVLPAFTINITKFSQYLVNSSIDKFKPDCPWYQ